MAVQVHDQALETSVLATVLAPDISLDLRKQMYAQLSVDMFAPRGYQRVVYECLERWRKQSHNLPDATLLSRDPRTPKVVQDALPALAGMRLRSKQQYDDAVVALAAWGSKRALLQGCQTLSQLLQADTYDEERTINVIRELQRRVTRPAGMAELVLDPRDAALLDQTQRILDQAQEHQRKRWPTGWPTLDQVMGGGLGPLDIMLLSANTGGGKSMAALALAMHMAEQGANVCYFSFEMSQTSMAMRAMARHAGVTRGELAGGQMSPEDLAEAAKRFAAIYHQYAGKLRILTPEMGFARPTVDYLEGVIQRDKTDIVIVDYLAMLNDPSLRNVSDEVRLRTATADLKMLAAATQTGIIALAQLNEDGNDIKHSRGAKDACDFVVTWSSKSPNNVETCYEATILKKREQPGKSPDNFWLEQDYDHLRIYEPDVPPTKQAQANVVADALHGYGKA